MSIIKKYIGDLFISQRFYLYFGSCILLFILSFFIPILYPPAKILFSVFILIAFIDYFYLFFVTKAPYVKRIISDRLSNGDENVVVLEVSNRMNYPLDVEIIDELPEQFQMRNFSLKKKLAARQVHSLNYTITPVERGQYHFGDTHLYTSSWLGLVKHRFTAITAKEVYVYPSYMQLKKYQIISRTALITEHGGRRMRKIGHSMEFEQIKDYVTGDDVRSLNWKATARKGALMINNYVDERSQQVYCIIDKGRLMKMPFNSLTLLDYAINSTLVLSSVCLKKQDKIGLMTFGNKMGAFIVADRKPIQREKILDTLFNQQTAFLESDFELLYLQVRNKIKQRSLVILYTNFESLNGLRRQISYMRSIAKHHLLLVVFFENTELMKLSHANAQNLEDVYVKTIADKFIFEKKLIVKELQKYGILCILTAPENLTVHTVNKYLELKTRQAI